MSIIAISPQYYIGPGKAKDERESQWARNHMMFDFGYDEDMSDLMEIKAAIRKIEGTFDLVMITGRFDESLVLLKHLLCLPSFSSRPTFCVR